MSSIISNNSDFLFLYDATQCNPNGDIDQENRPRMDYDTDTNLVTDIRVKRYIRDYLRHENGLDIFVDMEGNNKVSPSTRLQNVIIQMLANDNFASEVLKDDDIIATFNAIKRAKVNSEDIFKFLQGEKSKDDKKEIAPKDSVSKLNYHLLAHLVKEKFIDIRFFGSAFAIAGFTKSYIGPIQLNWGYSLHKVQIMESNSIVTIMNDGSSTIGKDYRVYYSLLAFNGTINKHAAKSTFLTTDDVKVFRNSIWSSISALPTRSKLNQYPKLYVEIEYNDGYSNGHFGDLRKYVSAKAKVDGASIRHFEDLDFDVSALKTLIAKGKEDGIIKDVHIKATSGITL